MVSKKRLESHSQAILLAAGFVLLIAISAATGWMVNQSAADSQLVARTLTVQDKLSNLLLSIRRAESAERGYLFTGDAAYFDEYKTTIPETTQLLSELKSITADDSQRQRMINQISLVTKSKYDEMEHAIALNSSGAREEARALFLNGNGRDTMNSLRSLAERSITDEGRLLTERSQQSKRNNQVLLVITLTGAVLIAVIGGLVITLVQRTVKQRETALEELASTNANLERIVEHRTADLTEANEEIQRFAYIVTHDLRSPLVNIMGFTSELERFRMDIFLQIEKLREQLSALSGQVGAHEQSKTDGETLAAIARDFDEAISFIKASIAKMDRLINAVLKLSREGRREFRAEAIDMREMLHSITQTMAHRASEQGATVAVTDLPPVTSDRLAIEQIFSNLVDNALKYGRQDEAGRIEIKGHFTPSHVVYTVRDNGRGIDPRDHRRVFELFRRSGLQDRPGEGIGLAHVRALVRRLGGHMDLSSELGKGSIFTVTLPRQWMGENRSAA
jgi:signal transduction histidine kinase